MTELELKFQIPHGGRAGLIQAVGERHLERVQMDARYADTPDQLLARHRFALRLRCENGRWVQTLKASMPQSLERYEHEVELAAGCTPACPTRRCMPAPRSAMRCRRCWPRMAGRRWWRPTGPK